MIRSIITFVMLLIVSPIYGIISGYNDGTQIQLSGRVLDIKTGVPLPFVNIIYMNAGTTTNLDGEFIFTIMYHKDHNRLLIKFIGYESSNVVLSGRNTDMIIKMQSSTEILDEVIIYTANQVIIDVNNHHQINYEFNDQILSSYYKESVSSPSECYYLAEGILEIYYPTVYSKEKPTIQAKKTRKKEFVSMDSMQVPLFHGHASDMINGITRRSDSFINANHIQDYNFTKEALTKYDGREVFIIRFEPKNKKANCRGILYIDSESKAIIRAEYYPNIDNQRFWTSVKWVEEYKEVNSTWYIHRVSYLGQWKEGGKTLSYEALLVVTAFEFLSTKPDFVKEPEKNDIFFDEAVELSDNFWDGYNYVKLNLKEKDVLTRTY